MDKPLLPKYFRESDTLPAKAVRIMSDMQAKMLESFEDQYNFLSEVIAPEGLHQQRLYMYYPSSLMYPDATLWAKLSPKQKEDLNASFIVIDPVTKQSTVPGLLDVDTIGIALRSEGFNLKKNFDFTIAGNVIQFVSDISVEEWDRVSINVLISGRPTPALIQSIPVLMYRAWFSEDWYYKRLGVLLGLDEGTSPYLVIAVYKLFMQSSTEANLDALFSAYKGYGVSLRAPDTVVELTDGFVTTEQETYPVISYTGSTPLCVRVGDKLGLNDPLMDVCRVVNATEFKDWVTNDSLLALLSSLGPAVGMSYFETKLRALISDNSALIWGSDLPIRISVTDEESLGLWLSAPVSVLPVLKFSLGADATAEEIGVSPNIRMYSTLDQPRDIVINVAYSEVTEEATVTFPASTIPMEVLAIDSGGVFVSVTGISGRVLDSSAAGTWAGSIVQDRSVIAVVAASTTDMLEFSFGATFNEGFSPSEGDWIWFYHTIDSWHKVKITETISDVDGNTVGAKGFWYGQPVPSLGNHSAIIFQSYNGEPYTGVDNARLDAFGELLELVSRHIEIVVVNEDIITMGQATACLAAYKEQIDVWKAFIVIGADSTQKFIEFKEKLNGISF